MKKVVHTGKFIAVLYRTMIMYMSDKLKCHGLSNIEYSYLMILNEENNLSMDELTKRSLVDKSQTTRAIKLLLEKELINKEKNKEDARSYIISLTDLGKETALKIYDEIIDFETALNENIPFERQRQMKRDLTQMIRNLKEDSHE